MEQLRGVPTRPGSTLAPPCDGAGTHEVDISVTFVELYKEEFLDLLSGDTKNTVTLREPKSGDWCLCGAREVTVRGRTSCLRAAASRLPLTTLPRDAPQVNNLGNFVEALSQGVAQRATAATRMNINSSRSHAVLTITVRIEPIGGGAPVNASLGQFLSRPAAPHSRCASSRRQAA